VKSTLISITLAISLPLLGVIGPKDSPFSNSPVEWLPHTDTDRIILPDFPVNGDLPTTVQSIVGLLKNFNMDQSISQTSLLDIVTTIEKQYTTTPTEVMLLFYEAGIPAAGQWLCDLTDSVILPYLRENRALGPVVLDIVSLLKTLNMDQSITQEKLLSLTSTLESYYAATQTDVMLLFYAAGIPAAEQWLNSQYDSPSLWDYIVWLLKMKE
jgi:hypothetical protein